jgi:hypothetical protein
VARLKFKHPFQPCFANIYYIKYRITKKNLRGWAVYSCLILCTNRYTIPCMIWIKVFMVSIILRIPITTEAGLLVRVHPDPCLILIRAQIRALLLASKSKFIRAQTLTLQVLDKKKRPLLVNTHEEK